MSDASFPLFLTASLSFPYPVRDLVRPRKTVRIREAVRLLMGKQPLPIGPDVESVVNGSPRRRIHRTAHISTLPCVGEEPVLPSNHEWFHCFPFRVIVTEGKPAVHEIGHPIVLHRQGICNGGSEKGFSGYLCGDASNIAEEFVELRFDQSHPLLLPMLAERQWSSECGSWYSG